MTKIKCYRSDCSYREHLNKETIANGSYSTCRLQSIVMSGKCQDYDKRIIKHSIKHHHTITPQAPQGQPQGAII